MTRSICHEGYQISVALTVCTRPLLVEDSADRFNDTKIGTLCTPTDIVAFAQLTRCCNECQGARMVLDVEPVTDICPCPINRQWLFIERVKNDERDQLFRKMERPIIIRAIGEHYRQTISFMPSAHQMIGCGFEAEYGEDG